MHACDSGVSIWMGSSVAGDEIIILEIELSYDLAVVARGGLCTPANSKSSYIPGPRVWEELGW